jgi:hypothetical protein
MIGDYEMHGRNIGDGDKRTHCFLVVVVVWPVPFVLVGLTRTGRRSLESLGQSKVMG